MNSIRGKNVFTIFLCFVLCFSALIFAAGCSGNNRHEEQHYIVSFEKTSSENSEDVTRSPIRTARLRSSP